MTVKAPPRKARPASDAAEKPSRWLRAGRWIWRRARREARRLLPAWIFFFLSFTLLRLTQTAVLLEYGVQTLPPSKVLIGALIVAKALLTVDTFRFFTRLESQPVILAALLKTALYAVLVFFFEYSETLYQERRQSLAHGHEEFVRQLGSLRFWIIQLWVVVLLFAFSAVRTLSRRLGPRRFRRLLIGR